MRTNTIRKLSGVGAAIMLLAVTGCQTSNHNDERSEGRVKDDKSITSDVKKSLESDATYKFNDVKVDTFAGVVQLSGFVNIGAQRMRAQEIAQVTDGVAKVVNGIALKPPMQPTGRAAVERMYADPAPAQELAPSPAPAPAK